MCRNARSKHDVEVAHEILIVIALRFRNVSSGGKLLWGRAAAESIFVTAGACRIDTARGQNAWAFCDCKRRNARIVLVYDV